MPQNYLIKTVANDIKYLKKTWDDSVDDDTLRRESVILRRLLIEGDIHKAWKASGLEGKIHVIAPRAEYFLESQESVLLNYLIAGGGFYYGLYIALAMDNVGNKPIELPQSINPMEYNFNLKEFLSSTSIFVEQTKISRQDIIQYVANKLGGAHLDFKRKGKAAEKQKIIDRNIHRFAIKIAGYPSINDKNAVYFELMSIGQLFSQSANITRFLERAEKITTE